MENIQVLLRTVLYKLGDNFTVYAPALELTASGRTVDDARKEFSAQLALFIQNAEEARNLSDVLLDLGWKLQRKPVLKYSPPVYKSHYAIKLPPSSVFLLTERQMVTFPINGVLSKHSPPTGT